MSNMSYSILYCRQVSRAESALVSKSQSSFIINPSISEKVALKHSTCSSLLNACLGYIKAEHFQWDAEKYSFLSESFISYPSNKKMNPLLEIVKQRLYSCVAMEMRYSILNLRDLTFFYHLIYRNDVSRIHWWI